MISERKKKKFIIHFVVSRLCSSFLIWVGGNVAVVKKNSGLVLVETREKS